MTGSVGKGRSRKTWKGCVENDLKRFNLDPSVAADRESWRLLVRVYVWPVLAWNMTLNDWSIDWLITPQLRKERTLNYINPHRTPVTYYTHTKVRHFEFKKSKIFWCGKSESINFNNTNPHRTPITYWTQPKVRHFELKKFLNSKTFWGWGLAPPRPYPRRGGDTPRRTPPHRGLDTRERGPEHVRILPKKICLRPEEEV